MANIYLDKLDKYIKEYTAKFDKGKKRKFSRESMDFGNARKRIVRRLKFVKDERQRTKLILELKAIEQGRAKYPNGEEMDADYRRMKYARYADDFLVGFICCASCLLPIIPTRKSSAYLAYFILL